MNRGSLNRVWATSLALFALVALCVPAAHGQAAAPTAETSQLLGKAHALEVRGRMDMARQVWQQVLLSDPKNTDALAGMARAAKLEGKSQESNDYLNKLRAVNPNDPNIERIQQMGTQSDMSGQLAEAGRLAQAGQYARAMTILRQVYGTNPPPGEAAVSYYQTEAATEDGRPAAIAGLRALVDKYPQDSRYQITLGKILTYNPRTRDEGRKLLEKHPNDPDAVEALRQSLVWDAQSPATAGAIKVYLSKHKDAQLSAALAQTEANAKRSGQRVGGPAPLPPSPEQLAEQAQQRERNAESQAAYASLNGKRYQEAESRFQAMLAKDPRNAQALAGLGYVRMAQSNFGGAITYLHGAVENGSRDAGVAKALKDSQFFYTMQIATTALNENDLASAQLQFTNASHMRPNDPSPLLGLGGTLMKAQQPAEAVPVFTAYVRMAPNDKAAWRGLFMSQYGASQYQQVLATDTRIPASIKRQLIHDPEYLRDLAATYQALGRDADAQRVLRSALELPFPADSRGMREDLQLQYAGLLETAGQREQAAGLYRQVLEGDSTNTQAYEGLINLDHVMGHDAAAYQVLQSMPPSTYEQAMQAGGFPTLVAAIYTSQNQYSLAQQTLETYIQNLQASNQPVPVNAEVQLAGIYIQHGDTAHAYPMYTAIVRADPSNSDAWNGLITALHSTGHDQEALAEIQQIPPNTRLKLEQDPAYLQTVGSIYAGLKQYTAAMTFYNRVQQRYVSQRLTPPSGIDIQEAWLLFNSHNDPILMRQLLMLGGRGDLSDEQRMTVQTIWANWAVRRANENIAQGNFKRALGILNAAASAFPGNPDVLKALGSGYAAVGLSKQAVEIYRAQDLSQGTLEDYRAAVGAALTANDLKDAEVWLRFGLDQYPRDGQLLVMAARFETARGDSGRAAEYYKASLKVFPKDDPGSMLTDEMLRPLAVRRVQRAEQSKDLVTLLGETDPHNNKGGNNGLDLTNENPRPYLPSYLGTPAQAPVQIDQTLPSGQYAPQHGVPGGGYIGNTSPGVTTTPAYDPATAAQQQQLQQRSTQQQNYNPNNTQQLLQQQQRTTTLRNYTPQSQLPATAPTGPLSEVRPILYLHPDPAMEAKYGPYVSYDPSAGLPKHTEVATNDASITAHFVTASFHAPQAQQEPSQPVHPLHLNYPQPPPDNGAIQPAPNYAPSSTNYLPAPQAKQPTINSPQATGSSASDEFQPRIDYKPPVNGYAPPKTIQLPQSERRAPATTRTQNSVSKPAATAPSSVSQPYSEQSFPTPTHGFTALTGTRSGPITSSRKSSYPQPGTTRSTTRTAAQQGNTSDGTPIVPYISTTGSTHRTTSSPSVRDRAEAIRRNQAQAPEELRGQAHPPAESLDAEPSAQIQNTQFNPSTFQNGEIPQPGPPQDNTNNSRQTQTNLQPVAPSQNVAPDRESSSYGQQYPQPETHKPAPRRRTQPAPKQQPVQPPPAVNYPSYTQPLANPGYPNIPAQYPLVNPPSDYQLQQKDVPPLRGYFDPRVDETTPLTDRQQAELDLATLEGSYSSWIGASVIGAYRSGTKGIDRMASVEVPFEASFALGKSWRFTAIPMPIFLDSGQLAPNGNLGAFPVFGTVNGASTQVYPVQYSVGLGGEAQLTSNTFSIAGGYSAYGFLVRNGIGRFRWKPGNGHFTLFGGRDPVKDTQLSYAGLRDPGQPNAFTLGPIWGGVVQTGGGVRIDAGSEKSGLYMQAEGSVLTGYHVQDNHKYDGTFGAYFRAHVWPEYGSLNIGAALFGEHYDYNERIESYGWGGYFSPNVYFLFAVPVGFTGHYKEQLHYSINGSVGVQTFQENSEPYYPLDQSLQLNLESNSGSACTGLAVGAAQPCGFIPSNSNTGLNYSIDARLAYQVTDHWYIGGFLTGNNTNNYNTVSGGFFARYTFKTQAHGTEYPTGLFPVQGFRPLRVP